jgi:predicted DNA-binding ribbon-helix-helix protein
MCSGVVKRSVSIAGHRTSISLEEPFWEELRAIASARGISVQALVGTIDAGRGEQNLSSAIRVFVLRTLRDRVAADSLTRPDASQPAAPA